MSVESDEPKAVIVMKVGYHGNEDIKNIVSRKKEEEKKIGHSFWGYGGSLCHPTRVVQPFAKHVSELNGTVKVLFSITKSPFRANPESARYYSADGKTWAEMPKHSSVLASRYALAIKSLRTCDSSLALNRYRVAIGPSKGKPLNEYLRYRVDKAAATLDSSKGQGTKVTLPIHFMAELASPYAILVSRQRNADSW